MKYEDSSEDTSVGHADGKRVIVRLDEKEKVSFDRENQPKEISINGVLDINNTSSSYRVYNAYLSVTNHGLTDVSEGRYPVGEVAPEKSWRKDYTVSTETPTLTLKEIVDTNYGEEAEEVHRAFYVDKENPTSFKISIKNEFDHDISSVELKKTTPSELADIEVSAESGEASVDEGKRLVKWTLDTLKPSDESTLTVKGILRPNDSEPIKCGSIETTFKVEEAARAGLDLDLDSLTKSLSSMNVCETESAGKWSCGITFDNTTDLVTILNEFVVTGAQGEVAHFKPDAEVAAGKSWNQNFEFSSKNVPELEKSIKFRVAHEVHRSIDGYVFKEDDIIPVGKITCSKQFDPDEIPAYETFDLKAVLTTENAGSVELDSVKFVDKLPRDFKPPKTEDVQSALGSSAVECQVQIEPEDEEHDREHTITITVPNLSESKTGFKPGDKLIAVYPIVAIGARPPTETKYPAQLHVTAFCRPPGLGTDSETSSEKPPEIVVKYVKRVLTGATGFESVEPGVYEITIQATNKGEGTLENVVVEHLIPPEFEFVEYSPKRLVMEEEGAAEGKKVRFTIAKMNKGAGETIIYRIKGKPDAEYKQSEAKFKVLGPHKKE
jgi:uncharacterized repeat protein (TIGR01451 family)